MSLNLFLVTLGFIASLSGWGWLLQKLARTDLPHAVNPALGLSLLIALGGILVSLSLASLPVIMLAYFAGIIAAVYGGFRTKYAQDKAAPLSFRLLCTRFALESRHYLGAVALFLVYFPLYYAPAGFNIHDDFEKYFKYPVRLLETGNLNTGLFDAVGTETLGGMAFLHEFALAFGPFAFLNVIDYVAGSLVCMLVVVAVCRRFDLHWSVSILSSLLLVFIDPLYVNISASYTGAALYLLLFAIPLWLDVGSRGFEGVKAALLMGMGYAGLAALKTSLAFFIPAHFVVLMLAYVFVNGARRGVFLNCLRIPLLTSFFLIPWVLASWQKFSFLLRSFDLSTLFAAKAVDTSRIDATYPVWEPLSSETLFYGLKVANLHYTVFVIGIFLLMLAYAFRYRQRTPRLLALLYVSFTLLLSYFVFMTLAAPKLVGLDSGYRYVVPLLLCGVLVFPILQAAPGRRAARAGVSGEAPGAAPRGNLYFRISGMAALVLACVAFTPSFASRLQHTLDKGYVFDYLELDHEEYLELCNFVPSAAARMWLQEVQFRIPEGEPFLSWMIAPFQLDYKRNPVWDADPAGFTSPWLDFPFEGSFAEQVDYFRLHGVRWIYYQHSGLGVREQATLERMIAESHPRRKVVALRTLQMREFLRNLARATDISEIEYENELLRLVHILPEADGE